MNEFEQRIRELTLREPGDKLDERVLSSLRGTAGFASHESGRAAHVSTPTVNTHHANSPPHNEPTRMRRGIFSGTISGLVAALLIGIAIGNGLPSVWSRFGDSTTNRPSAMPLQESVLSVHDANSGDAGEDEGFPEHHRMKPDLPQHLRDALKNRSTAGSQFVELSYLSAIAGASLWERQNGERFNVTTHVSDRRFDMCRDCHRVGG